MGKNKQRDLHIVDCLSGKFVSKPSKEYQAAIYSRKGTANRRLIDILKRFPDMEGKLKIKERNILGEHEPITYLIELIEE